ncbi:hypothetical protein CC80DRAFT_258450 [Byssothecium circinans]|uniref:Mid2 domain-containing protein n=1 Tax=Byssothecium circinans TaxID=147558 RepID=A0A6A5U743_9PLEO|nr:hypothetical protein CC80DRAFT_258450 [Byssothecium circinans]
MQCANWMFCGQFGISSDNFWNTDINVEDDSLVRMSRKYQTLRTLILHPSTSAYDPTDSTFSVCNTGFLYENTADPDALTNIFCGVSSVNWSYYRVRPDITSPTPSPRSPQSTPASTTPTPTPSPSPGPQPPPEPRPPEKSSSKAWIAGVVVGPVVGLALLGAIIFFFMRRKKKTTTLPAQPLMAQQAGPNSAAPSYPGSPNQAHQSAYFAHQQKPGMAPFGVASQGSWAPQSPTTQGSVSPHPPQSPYAPPPQQQWQPMPQQGQQMYPPPMTGSPPPQMQQNMQAYKQPEVNERPFSAELDGGGYPNVGGAVAPPQQPR